MATSQPDETVTVADNKNEIIHDETLSDEKQSHVEDINGRIFSIDEAQLPAGYYRTVNFWGSLFAIGLSLACGVAGFALPAPILGIINADIGPSPYVTWVALTYTLTGAVGLMIVGRLTDLFGRRWFFIGGGFLGILGSIVCATAPNINAMIAGVTLIGLASSAQLSFSFAVAELVPMKHRFLAIGYIYFWNTPLSSFGSAVAYAFVYKTKVGWRGCFYLLIAMNVVATLCWYLFYFPPNFQMKHGKGRKMRFIKQFDYVGTFLATMGLLLFLMGLSWGGSLHPWKSAHVISTIIIGFLLLVAFFLYEAFAPLKEPLLPMHLFRNRGWFVSILLLSIGASVYYAFAIVWPSMVVVLYSEGHSHMWVGWASSAVGAGVSGGELVGAVFGHKWTKYQIIFFFSTGSLLLALMATCTADTPGRACALIFTGAFFIGFNEVLNSVNVTICVNDQREIGTATGIGGSCRSFISTICATVYTVVLTNRLEQTIPTEVPKALTEGGLPASSVPAFLGAITAGTPDAFAAVKGLTPQIQAIGLRAYQVANANAYRTVFLSTIAFSGVGIILTFFAPNVEKLLTKEVVVTMHEKETGQVMGTSSAVEPGVESRV